MLSLISLFSEIVYSRISYTLSNTTTTTTTTQKVKNKKNLIMYYLLRALTQGGWLGRLRAHKYGYVNAELLRDWTESQAKKTPRRRPSQPCWKQESEGGDRKSRGRGVQWPQRDGESLSIIFLGDPSSVTAASEDCHTWFPLTVHTHAHSHSAAPSHFINTCSWCQRKRTGWRA